jgi:hypothetical protein
MRVNKKSSSVERLALSAISVMQPDGKLPDWFLAAIGVSMENVSDDIWDVKVYVYPMLQLEEGYRWKQEGSFKTLVKINEKIGTEEIVINDSRLPDQFLILFEVEIDEKSGTSRVLRDSDLSKINPDDLDIRTFSVPDVGNI